MKDSKQPEMAALKTSKEFANFVLLAASRCVLPPEDFFLAAGEALAAAAISWTQSREGALSITECVLKHSTFLISEFYQGPSGSVVLQ